MNKARPKTILLLNQDRYFYPAALDEFLSQNHSRISKVFIFPSFTDATKKREYEIASMKIMGPKFIVRYLGGVLFSFLKPWGSIEQVARAYSIPIEKLDSVNSPAFISQIKKENYEVGLSMVSQIYRDEILSIPLFALYNFHPSLLPRNKGKFPIFWAFLRREKEQGITCHRITQKIDAGEIVFQKLFELKPNDNVVSVLERFVKAIPEYMQEALDRIEAHCSQNSSQNSFENIYDQMPNLQNETFYGPTPTATNIADYHHQIKNQREKQKNSKNYLKKSLDFVKKNYDSKWYLPVMSLITATNIFVVVLPVEALLIGGIVLRPKTWLKMAFWQTIAGTLATLALAFLVAWKGQLALDWLAPGIQQKHSWAVSTQMMQTWGVWALLVMSIIPVPILPGIAFAVFSKMSSLDIFVAVFVGRAIKFYGMCFTAAYFPGKFKKVA